MHDISFTQNRELSWLLFNERVLEEAQDGRVPLLERLKFLSIFDSNLDEFFMVRVGSLTDLSMLNKRVIDNKSEMDQDEQLAAIMDQVKVLYQKKDYVFKDLRDQCRAKGFYAVENEELTEHEERILRAYFENTVSPYLSYQIVDLTHPFPRIPNLGIVILYRLRKKGSDDENCIGIIQVPPNLKRAIRLDKNKHILLEKVIEKYGAVLFESYSVEDAYTMSLTRNADIDWDDEDYEFAEDYRSHMKKMLKKRKRLMPVRLEFDRLPPKEVLDYLLKNLSLDRSRVFVTTSPVRLGYLFDMVEELAPHMGPENLDEPFEPQNGRDVDENLPMMEQIEKRDIFLSYPYESMEPIIRLLDEAANDPSVVSIKVTLYRIAKNSLVAEKLMEAAENGKDVIVLMELRARFDEENNILWSSNLESAGCRVIYGFNKFKCHSKVLLITRVVDSKPVYIAQIATGNYNEKTAKLYTDFALLTAHQGIGRDVNRLFDNFLIGELKGSYEYLWVSPKSLPEGVEAAIDEEIDKVKNGGEGYIRLKMNSISDRKIIDILSEASNAGVKVDMLVRGITCIVPKIPERTENISVYSVVGRFLEHHRVYQFGKGDDAKVYISSADFMTRNVRKRVEVACPVLDPSVKKRVLEFMDIMFKDDVKRRELLPSKRYVPVENKENFIAQDHLMKEAEEYERNRKERREEKVVAIKSERVKPDNFFTKFIKKIFG
ncbi:polyphosphate kinase 1 [Aedoeadaptatus coxii]|uniref:Polyphosphate kinase n=1 Tax=Aedoeadaptatus coxii TaxID=755172 RepID=A0A134AI61_9FIRM|nr:polyphosphate kinase 1 [Peptoniphilus coxii]KXB67354.1 polyphosphate kinase 1 [Peptoniphilus coxii]CAC9933760.1 polyphosphate kinase 1 [Peptoniphilus coxii]